MAREKKRFSFSSLSESTWAAAFRGYYYSPVTARIKAADRRHGFQDDAKVQLSFSLSKKILESE